MPRTKKSKPTLKVPETPSAQLLAFHPRPHVVPDTPSAQLLADKPDTPSSSSAQQPLDTPSAQLFAEKRSLSNHHHHHHHHHHHPDTPLRATGKTVTKKTLFDDDDDDDDEDDSDEEGEEGEEEFHSAEQSPVKEEGFRINEEYARRFEHNKKREELQRLEEKYGKGKKRAREDDDEDEDSEESSSSSEDEDDIAELATEQLDQEIMATLQAIRSKDPRVYDGKTTFYKTPIEGDGDAEEETEKKEKKEKPMYLRDYHTQNLLAGVIPGADSDDEDAPKTFAQEQADLKRTVVKEMHAAAAGSDSDSDSNEAGEDFLVRKPGAEAAGASSSSKTATLPLPDPATADENPDEYLLSFLKSRAWTKNSGFRELSDDDDDSDDDAQAAEFEAAYNLRFEDPSAASRADLISYSRRTVAAASLRRDDKSARKKAREEKRRRKEAEKAQREQEKRRLHKLRTEELLAKFRRIRDAAGFASDEEVEAEVLEKLLDDEFSDAQWEEWSQRRFGDEYYGKKDATLEKPEFDDDIDITDIVPDFDAGAAADEDDEDGDEDTADGDAGKHPAQEQDGEDPDGDIDMDADAALPTKKSQLKSKQRRKAQDRAVSRKLAASVSSKLAASDFSGTFRYRQTTPESFGLSALDVLAAGDPELNQFAGLKKYAPFRPAEKKRRDRKKLAKKRRLREWRREVFGHEDGVVVPEAWGTGEGAGADAKGAEAEFEPAAAEREREARKKRKRRRKNKSAPAGA